MLRALWVAAAIAAAPSPSALEEGRELYLKLEYGRAVEKLRDAVATLKASLPETGAFGPLGDALTLLAASQLSLKDEAGARAAFEEALQLRPAFEVDVNTYGPKVADAFERARAQWAARPKATLSVRAQPAASVLVDGVARGTTPLEVAQLSVGWHAVRLDAPGHLPWWGMVEVAVGGSTVTRALEALPGEAPSATATAVPPPPAPPKRLHVYGAPFVDVLNKAAGGEVGASWSFSSSWDVVASAALGPTVAPQLGLAWGMDRAARGVRPFAQARAILLPYPSGLTAGAGLWAGASAAAGPGRAVAGVAIEAYRPTGAQAPFGLFVLAGYELDVL